MNDSVKQPMLLKISEVCFELGCSRSTVYRLIRSNELLSVRIRGDIRVPQVALERLTEVALTAAARNPRSATVSTAPRLQRRVTPRR